MKNSYESSQDNVCNNRRIDELVTCDEQKHKARLKTRESIDAKLISTGSVHGYNNTAEYLTMVLSTQTVKSIIKLRITVLARVTVNFYNDHRIEKYLVSPLHVKGLFNTPFFKYSRQWAAKNCKEAREKLNRTKPVRELVEKLRLELCQLLELKGIKWDCGWDISHFKGCLVSFQTLCEHHRRDMESLKGRYLVFGNTTGVVLDGTIVLNSGEVRHNGLI
ncbi:uncharacterized protein LOC113469643 [Diaphorina citri]|uniref:Uncharacterized protein LOC113469643 n=1 Tax=Diaphorina citri TaxID=121845 RepID=A0A3Q0J9A6_DIACI|nr:uncharacterized protein LOC113469643 [Diaphorina citri]